jgi:hypothetical protein
MDCGSSFAYIEDEAEELGIEQGFTFSFSFSFGKTQQTTNQTNKTKKN